MSRCELPSDIPELQGHELQGITDDGKPFAAPWEAQAFAMTVALHERGLFAWSEWAEALSAEISRARGLGDPDDGRAYWRRWLAALERIVVVKGVTSAGMLGVLKEQWDVAARETPHGEPVLLG